MLAAAGVNGPDGILKAMSIFLAGAGPDATAFPDIFDRFAHDVRAHAGQGKAARIAVAVHHDGPNLQDLVAAYAEPLKARIDCGVTVVPLAEEPAGATAVDNLDAIVVGGGLTPAWWRGWWPLTNTPPWCWTPQEARITKSLATATAGMSAKPARPPSYPSARPAEPIGERRDC